MRKATAVRNAQLALSQPAREENIAAIVAHLRAGAKAECRRVGIELEHICVDGTGDPITYSQPNGVRDVLAALQEKYPEATVHGGDLLGVFHRKDVGDIDLVWGDENGGLAHILNKHVGESKSFANVDEAMSHIQNIVETGKNDFEDGDKIVFRKGSELVTVRKNFREGGKKTGF